MSFRPDEYLCCPVCRDLFKDPVLLLCTHSFCKACWQRWWTGNSAHQCPVCKTKSSLYNPPRNLALKNLCDAFPADRVRRRSADVCVLHSEELKLFCLEHQQPVCTICLHSSLHTNHSFRPVGEAATDYREGLRWLVKPLQEKLVLFNDIKGNFDQTAEDIDVQAQDAERQIKDEFSSILKFLRKEERERIAAVQEEQKQKSRTMKRKTEALSRETEALSDTVRATEEVLRAEDLSFLQNYTTAAEIVDRFQIADPQPISGGLIDTAKHLNNLPFAILDSVRKMIPTPEVLDPKTNPEPQRYCPTNLYTSSYCFKPQSHAVSTRAFGAEAAILPSPTTLLKSFSEKIQTIEYDFDEDMYG